MVIGSPASALETDSDSDVEMNDNDALMGRHQQQHPTAASLSPSFGGRIVWNGSDGVSLQDWIRVVRPSFYSNDQEDADPASFCCWIQVHVDVRLGGRHPSTTNQNHTLASAVVPDWSRYEIPLAERSNTVSTTSDPGLLARSKQRCIDRIMELAKEDGFVAGKWLIFCSVAETDAVWEKIAEATAQGRLGPTSKVSPTKHLLRQQETTGCDTDRQKNAVICVYVDDSTDRGEVKRVLEVLRKDLGVASGVSRFKPDIFTELGIYGGNSWKLPPTLYTARDALGWD